MTDLNTLQEYLAFADGLAEKAGQLLGEGFYGNKKIDMKGGASWNLVTDYDKKIEKLIMDAIKETYPTHQVIAEEESEVKGIQKLTILDPPTWLVDPIDGTYNYAHGLPLTCISIGLVISGQVVLGLVYNPLSNSKYTAIRGKGAFLNGNPIRASKQEGLNGCIASFELSLIRHPLHRERNLKRYVAITDVANGIRIIGSAALSLCMVASGGLDVFIHEYLQPWDIAAGSLIIQEAGGFVCHTNGDQFNTMGKNIIAGNNKKITEEILEIHNKFQ